MLFTLWLCWVFPFHRSDIYHSSQNHLKIEGRINFCDFPFATCSLKKKKERICPKWANNFLEGKTPFSDRSETNLDRVTLPTLKMYRVVSSPSIGLTFIVHLKIISTLRAGSTFVTSRLLHVHLKKKILKRTLKKKRKEFAQSELIIFLKGRQPFQIGAKPILTELPPLPWKCIDNAPAHPPPPPPTPRNRNI